MSTTTARKFRLLAPVVPESQLHEAVADALNLFLMPPVQWTCFPAGSVPLPPQFAAKLYRMGLKPSWPDILILHGLLYGIELKRVGGRLSTTRTVRTKRTGALRVVEGQTEIFPRLTTAGMVGPAVCCSVSAVLEQCMTWGIPMRRWS